VSTNGGAASAAPQLKLADAALDLAEKGYVVFPAHERTKKPATGNGFHDGTREERKILHWWDAMPNANIGIALGKSGATVFDIDSKSGADPEDVLAELEIDGAPVIITGEAPEPCEQHPNSLTGLRGSQVYFRGSMSGTSKLSVPGTEIRGQQHYVIAPPSIHPCGLPYEGALPAVEQLPEIPDWLRSMVTSTTSSVRAETVPEKIYDGEGRHRYLVSIAGSMRRRGLDAEEILATLRSVNEHRCRPPVEEERLIKIANSMTYEPAANLPQSDLETAIIFAERHGGRFRYVADRKMWLAWDETRWRRDADGEARRAAKETAHDLLPRAAACKSTDEAKWATKWAITARSEPRIRAALELAKSEREIAITPDALDSDPYLLACANGTIDLRTGELRESEPADLISLGTGVHYDGDAKCLRWAMFLREVFGNDEELIGFVKRLVGYSLAGEALERILAVLWGDGYNGKTTFIETIKRLLGDLAATADFSTFIRTRADRAPRNDLARLYRSRLVVASESGEGRELDEAVVKQITGRDTIAARYLYSELFEFKPEFTLMLVTNHRPRVDADDDAIWDRIRLVPFTQCFRGREDKELLSKLEAELPGILAWAVRGCLEWQRDGLGTAAAVTAATSEYRQEEDALGAFIEDCCELPPAGKQYEVSANDFRERYEAYCKEIDAEPLNARWIGRQLGKKGFETTRRKSVRFYQGLRLSMDAQLEGAS
jgi:putative DNA primase/helicase